MLEGFFAVLFKKRDDPHIDELCTLLWVLIFGLAIFYTIYHFIKLEKEKLIWI